MSELMRLCLQGPPDREAWPPPRLIGRYYGGRPGPTMVAFGGIHGNEPAGVHALARVLDTLASYRLDMCGQLIGLAGNRQGLAANRRYLEEDLNRIWGPERVDDPSRQSVEVGEQVAIRKLVDELADGAEKLVLLDLHTISSNGPPFCGIMDSYRNRQMAKALPITTIVGLGDYVHGDMLTHFHDLGGHTCVSVEGGQHNAPETVDRLESAIWIVAGAAGLFAGSRAQELVKPHHERLARSAAGLPGLIRNCHRHPVEEGDGFAMRPGFQNFSPIDAGQPLADSHQGTIVAPFSGFLVMPLYQPGGTDGFFAAKPVSKARRVWADSMRGPLFRGPSSA